MCSTHAKVQEKQRECQGIDHMVQFNAKPHMLDPVITSSPLVAIVKVYPELGRIFKFAMIDPGYQSTKEK